MNRVDSTNQPSKGHEFAYESVSIFFSVERTSALTIKQSSQGNHPVSVEYLEDTKAEIWNLASSRVHLSANCPV